MYDILNLDQSGYFYDTMGRGVGWEGRRECLLGFIPISPRNEGIKVICVCPLAVLCVAPIL